jgi:urease accessory protein
MKPQSRIRPGRVAAWLAMLVAPSAFAHVGPGEAYGFLTGFRHPLSGFDHVLAMVTVGLFFLWRAAA